MIDQYTGKKIVSPLDIFGNRTAESKELIAAGKLDPNDRRSVIYSEDNEQSVAENAQCSTS